jgi:invasion protein IalB
MPHHPVMRSVWAAVVILSALTPIVPAHAGASVLTYSPWTKFCFTEICFIGADGRIAPDCGARVSAVVIEHRNEAKRTLRVTVPASVDRQRGVRIGIDGSPPVERPLRCYTSGCMADIEAGEELIDRIKQGQKLVVEASDAGNSPIRFALPLAGFAAAYEGPAQQPEAFVSQPEKLQDELKAARDADRKTRCGED